MATQATIEGICEDIANRVATIASLSGRTYPYLVDTVNPPCAMVLGWPETMDYDATMQRGMDAMTYVVRLYVNRVAEQSAQAALRAYMAGSGDQSLKQAIDSAGLPLPSCGQPCRCKGVRNAGAYAIGTGGGDIQLLGCEFLVDVMA